MVATVIFFNIATSEEYLENHPVPTLTHLIAIQNRSGDEFHILDEKWVEFTKETQKEWLEKIAAAPNTTKSKKTLVQLLVKRAKLLA